MLKRFESPLNNVRCPLCNSPRTHNVVEIEWDGDDEEEEFENKGNYDECLDCWHMWHIERPVDPFEG